MAWIEFHGATIKRLKKFSDMRRQLNLSAIEGLGLLGSFWGEAIELAEDGDISKWNAEYLCDLTGLKLNPERVWSTLVNTGWIDLTEDGQILIHDWLEYAGRYLELRYRTSNPEKLAQIKDKYAKSVIRQTKDGQPYLTIPNQPNQPNQTKPNNVHFEQIWKKYPKPIGKKDAIRHFNASVKTEDDLKKIEIALNNYIKSERVFNGFIQNGSTWFNNWQDWVNSKEQVCQKCKGKGKYVSQTGYDIICDCPKGKR